jgi:hypothetical protein
MSSSKSVCSRQSQRSTFSSRSSRSSSDKPKRRTKSLFNLLQLSTTRQNHDDVSILSKDHLENDDNVSDEDPLSDEQKFNWFRKLDELDRCVTGIENKQTSYTEQTFTHQTLEGNDNGSIPSSSGLRKGATSSTSTSIVQEVIPEKGRNVKNNSSSATRPWAPSIQKENLTITNLFQVNQHQKQMKKMHGGNRSVSGKSHGSVRSVHSQKLQEVEIAKTVLLLELEQQKFRQEREDRVGVGHYHSSDQDALSVVSSYTAHDILDDLTECEDLDCQSVWSFRSSRSGRSRSRNRKKGGIGGQPIRSKGSSMSVISSTSAFQKHQETLAVEPVQSVTTHHSFESHRGRRQERCIGSRSDSRSNSVASTLATPMRIRTPLGTIPAKEKHQETEQLYRAFLKNLNKQERLAHDTKVLSSASNVRAAIEAHSFSKRSNTKIQTVQGSDPGAKEGGRPLSQQWAVDIFEDNQDWFSFNNDDFEICQSLNTSSTHSPHPHSEKPRGGGVSSHLDTSSVGITSNRNPTENGEYEHDVVMKGSQQQVLRRETNRIHSSDFKSTGRSKSNSVAYGKREVESASFKYDNQTFGATSANTRYTFCDDPKVLKRMQKKTNPISPSRINGSLGPKETLMKPDITSEQPFPAVTTSSNKTQVESKQGADLQLSRNAKPTNEKKNPKEHLDFSQNELFDGKETTCNSAVASSTRNNPTVNSETHMNDTAWETYDSGWEGFATSKKFESIPSGWETEEESDDDDCLDYSTPDTSHLNNASWSARLKIGQKSEWSETSPTGIVDLDSATEMEWLKGSTTDHANPNCNGRKNMPNGRKTVTGCKKLFSDDLFSKSTDDNI